MFGFIISDGQIDRKTILGENDHIFGKITCFCVKARTFGHIPLGYLKNIPNT